jgi:hypothetical protein
MGYVPHIGQSFTGLRVMSLVGGQREWRLPSAGFGTIQRKYQYPLKKGATTMSEYQIASQRNSNTPRGRKVSLTFLFRSDLGQEFRAESPVLPPRLEKQL